MAQAKIEVRLGSCNFTGDAEAAWLEKQLDKFLAHVKTVDPADESGDGEGDQANAKAQGTKQTLSGFLKSNNATSNQVRKFLATACWLTKKGSHRLATGDITKALSESRQGKLTNPAQCLNLNVGKGFCEKEGKQFYVTEDGVNSFGKTE
jgi:hypothetical protein